MCRQLDAAGIPPAHLVGNSLGGWVALELARRGRASSVLALSPAGGWTRAVDLQRMLLIFRVAGVLRRSKAIPRIAADPLRRRMLLRAMAEHADRLTTAQTAAIFEDMAECDVLAELIGGARESGPIKTLSAPCPIRVVWGALDRTLPFARYGRPMVAALPPCRTRGAGRRRTRAHDRRSRGDGRCDPAIHRRRRTAPLTAGLRDKWIPQMPPRETSWLAMTLRWISLVPSPTIISGASRK